MAVESGIPKGGYTLYEKLDGMSPYGYLDIQNAKKNGSFTQETDCTVYFYLIRQTVAHLRVLFVCVSVRETVKIGGKAPSISSARG